MLSCAMAADIGVGVLEVGGTWCGTDLTSEVLLCLGTLPPPPSSLAGFCFSGTLWRGAVYLRP